VSAPGWVCLGVDDAGEVHGSGVLAAVSGPGMDQFQGDRIEAGGVAGGLLSAFGQGGRGDPHGRCIGKAAPNLDSLGATQYLAPNPARTIPTTLNNGGGGIRTHGPFRVAGFQDRSHQPLDHPSRGRSPEAGLFP
jgi:hypothetical protein